jgi:hypothetical protein
LFTIRITFKVATTNAGQVMASSPLANIKIRKETDKGNSTMRINAVHLFNIRNNPMMISKIYNIGRYITTASKKFLASSGI